MLELPRVSVVISAKNEENTIRLRLENLLQQEYPAHLLQIILVSDGSTDQTISLVNHCIQECRADKNPIEILCLEVNPSRGKPAALNRAMEKVSGEIVVLTDCRQKFESQVIMELVRNFSDADVGCVSGELLFVEKDTPELQVEMGAYWRYEKYIRKLESSTGSVMGATGAIYAIRKQLFRPVPETVILDDVLIPIQVVEQGFRVVFDSAAIAYDTLSNNLEQEWIRKVRTLAGNWQLIGDFRLLGRAIAAGCFFRFFWHKIARLFVPIFLVGALAGSWFGGSLLYQCFFYLQVFLYGLLAISIFIRPLKEWAPIKLLHFFMLLNWAIIISFFTWMRGDIGNVWKK